jgi:hypothetical protein
LFRGPIEEVDVVREREGVVADLPNDDPRPGGVVLGDLESTLVEVVVLALFVVFWLVETAELWDQGIPPPAPNGGVSR